MAPTRATVVLLASMAVASGAVAEDAEARVSIDVKDAGVDSIVRLLVELGGRQAVFDQGLDCPLTLRLHEVPWLTALETTLRACGLGYEEEGGILWVASTARLREDAEGRRRLEETRPAHGPGLAVYRLSYARAERMAPLLQRFVAPKGAVTVDPRTNTLVIRY
jgi:type II secretory pathway component HofQ